MNSLIRISSVLLFFVLISWQALAGTRSVKPAAVVFPHLINMRNAGQMIRTVDSFLSVSIRKSDAGASQARICSCQILNLSSANYDHRHIALLAEKTNNGSAADFNAAKSRIEKEKKQLRRQFYDKVKVVSETSAVGSCHSMILQLKRGDGELQVYEILNADIH